MSAIEHFQRYRNDILVFAKEQFDFDPDPWQRSGMLAFASRDVVRLRISLQACAGPGKSCVLAICGWWFLTVMGQKGSHPKGAVVSCSQDNLRDNLWSEFRVWQNRSELLLKLFRWTSTRISSIHHPETWFLSARSFRQKANPDEIGRTLSGIHSRYVLFLIDESGDTDVQILKSAEQALSTDDMLFGRIVQAGNPTSRSGMLYCANSMPGWHVIKITGDPLDPMRSSRINAEWAKKQIAQYGRRDPWVMSYILGSFPDSASNTLVTEHEVDAAMGRHLILTDYAHAEKRLGVDVAAEGMDQNCIFPRQGLASFPYILKRQSTAQDIGDRIIMAKLKWGVEAVYCDDTGGYASGLREYLRNAGHETIGVNFASKAHDKDRYFNRRAEMWWRMAESVKRGCALPPSRELREELTTVKYSFKNGKFLIEPKDDIKERLRRSPDISDALALTHALPDSNLKRTAAEMIAQRKIQGTNSKGAKYYDKQFDEQF